MIEFAGKILEQLIDASRQAFQETVYPIASGGDFPEDVIVAGRTAWKEMPSVIAGRESPVTAIVVTIKQAVTMASAIARITPEDAFRQTMALIAIELSNEVEHLTDPKRREQYEDCSRFIEDDEFKVAVAVAATHLVASAARNSRTFDAEALAAFISAELDEGNAFMLADLYAIRAAARVCGISDTADNAIA